MLYSVLAKPPKWAVFASKQSVVSDSWRYVLGEYSECTHCASTMLLPLLLPLHARSVTFFGNIHYSCIIACLFMQLFSQSYAALYCRISGHEFIRTLGTIRFTVIPDGNRCIALLSPLLCACVPMHYHADIDYQLPEALPEDCKLSSNRLFRLVCDDASHHNMR